MVFIPRFEADTVNLSLYDELNDRTYPYQLAAIYLDGLMEVELTHTFSEGEMYSFEVSDNGDNLMYRGKIFITEQTDLQNYSTHPDFLYD
ncbi:hypothetical protein [Costertonia aggregata]|uniref:Uncharacterized protein n=1 Tax=Costertonia aggregata TaxID=343403 RepID=A0A7H9ARL0_9FLAO|nr:hypothetical protein [Costertonia aggregata]QLG46056.1 hypothetical protein HYG79_12105 [Costertonia aggregata]